MHRLFVAIQPPRRVREALLACMGGVPGARWQTDEQLHLTLRFIGEVDRHRAEDVAAALGQVRQAPFAVTLEGLGHFDRRGRIDALWIGARPQDPLKALHNKVDQALARIGIAPEGRAYLPHVTLARFGREAGRVAALPSGVPRLPLEVRDFCLFESTLSHTGSSYAIVTRYPLTGGVDPVGVLRG